MAGKYQYSVFRVDFRMIEFVVTLPSHFYPSKRINVTIHGKAMLDSRMMPRLHPGVRAMLGGICSSMLECSVKSVYLKNRYGIPAGSKISDD